jgi:hypothetical protein
MEQSQPKTILNAKIYPPQAGKAKQTQIWPAVRGAKPKQTQPAVRRSAPTVEQG